MFSSVGYLCELMAERVRSVRSQYLYPGISVGVSNVLKCQVPVLRSYRTIQVCRVGFCHGTEAYRRPQSGYIPRKYARYTIQRTLDKIFSPFSRLQPRALHTRPPPARTHARTLPRNSKRHRLKAAHINYQYDQGIIRRASSTPLSLNLSLIHI